MSSSKVTDITGSSAKVYWSINQTEDAAGWILVGYVGWILLRGLGLWVGIHWKPFFFWNIIWSKFDFPRDEKHQAIQGIACHDIQLTVQNSCTSWYGKYHIISKILYIPEPLPSTVTPISWCQGLLFVDIFALGCTESTPGATTGWRWLPLIRRCHWNAETIRKMLCYCWFHGRNLVAVDI